MLIKWRVRTSVVENVERQFKVDMSGTRLGHQRTGLGAFFGAHAGKRREHHAMGKFVGPTLMLE